MSCVLSPAKSIEQICFGRTSSIGSRPRRCDKIVCVDGVIVVKTKTGKHLTNAFKRRGAYLPGIYRWTKPLLKALVSLGTITQAEADQHNAHVAKRSEADTVRCDVEALAELQKKYGKGLTRVRAAARKAAAK